MSYLYLPGRAGNNATAPGSAATNITGDLAVAVRVFNPKPGLVAGLMSKWAVSTQWSLMWSSGTSQAYLYIKVAAGTFGVVAPSFFPTNFSTPMWIAATRRQSDGRVQFFYSNDQSPRPISEMTWTQVGADATLRAGDAIDSGLTSPIDFGSPTTGIAGSTYIGAHVYRGWVGSGADLATATTAFDANFEAQAPGTVSFTEDSVNAATVTVTSSATAPQAAIVGRQATGGLYLPRRTGNYATSPTAVVTSFDGDLDIAWCITLPNSAAVQVPCSQMSGTSSWYTSSGTYFRWYESGGTLREVGIGTDWAKVYGVPVWARWTLDVDTGAGTHLATLYRSTDPPGVSWPTNWTTLWSGAAFVGTTTRRAPSIGTSYIGMGGYGAAMPEMIGGIMHRFVMKNSIGGTTVFDADFSKQPRGTVSFAEDANGATVTVASSVNDPKAMILGRVG